MAGFRSVLFFLGLAAGPPPPPPLYGEPVARPVLLALVGGRDGRVLAELQLSIDRLSWELGGPGKAQLAIAPGPRVTEHNLQYGNRVLVRFDNGLPDWVGVITGPREWQYGALRLEAAGLLKALNWRSTPAQLPYDGMTADSIIDALLSYVPALRVASAPAGTVSVSVEYHFANVGRAVEQLLAVEDWAIEAVGALNAGVIGAAVNIFARRSRRRPNVALVEGHNVGEDFRYREEDAIVNRVQMVGAGTGWSEDTRMMAVVSDEASIAQYGVRETPEFVDEIRAVGALAAMGETIVARQAEPRQALQLTALNRPPGMFGQYTVGDVLRVMLPSAGFAGVDDQFEVLGREFRPAGNRCELVLEAV
jgi:hypothetical protein